MVKIRQAPLAGRVGESLSKGLADMLPDELAYRRRSQGLRAFADGSQDRDPMQNLAEISSVYGVTPQMLQSFADLSRLQQQKQAYARTQQRRAPQAQNQALQAPQDIYSDVSGDGVSARGEEGVTERRGLGLMDVVRQLPWQQRRAAMSKRPPSPEQERVPEIAQEPFLSEKALPAVPWTPQMRDERVQEYMSQGFLPDQARDLASDDERRYLTAPAAYQQRLESLDKKSKEARDELKRQIEIKLQKKGEDVYKQGDDVYKDVLGEMSIKLERGFEKDLRENPNMTVKDAANKWSNIALDLEKTKSNLVKLSNTTGIESFVKGNEVFQKLRSYQDIFEKSGNSEEYFNLLKSEMGLSPQAAAFVAYPVSEDVKKYILSLPYFPKNKKGKLDITDYDAIVSASQKAAQDISKMIKPDDSILSIAKSLSRKIYRFSQRDFFDELRKDVENIQLNERQKREIAEGERDILPNWSDIKIMPSAKKGEL